MTRLKSLSLAGAFTACTTALADRFPDRDTAPAVTDRVRRERAVRASGVHAR
jgi:hypothetical protein